MANVRSKVAVTSGKGGVGKSAVTANLAVSLASRGWRMGVLDADLNGSSIAKFLGVSGQRFRFSPGGLRPAEGPLGGQVVSMDLFLPDDRAPLTWKAPVREGAFVWRETMEATALRELLADTDWGKLDVLLVDLPPGAPKLPTAAELVPDLDGALVVTIPSGISRLVVGRAVELARSHGVTLLGLVENMTGYLCERCGAVGDLFSQAGCAPADFFGLPCLGRIPFDPRLAGCADRGAPYVIEHPETAAARAFADLADSLAGALRGGGGGR
jgi:ATP-binding protein involved in chromosome partitioning